MNSTLNFLNHFTMNTSWLVIRGRCGKVREHQDLLSRKIPCNKGKSAQPFWCANKLRLCSTKDLCEVSQASSRCLSSCIADHFAVFFFFRREKHADWNGRHMRLTPPLQSRGFHRSRSDVTISEIQVRGWLGRELTLDLGVQAPGRCRRCLVEFTG